TLVWRLPHPRQLDAVVVVGGQAQRFASNRLLEEIPPVGWRKCLHLLCHRVAKIISIQDDAGVNEEISELAHTHLAQRAPSVGSVRGLKRRQIPIPEFLEGQGCPGALQLPAQQRDLLVPIVGHQMNLLQIPVVIVLAYAGGPGLLWRPDSIQEINASVALCARSSA